MSRRPLSYDSAEREYYVSYYIVNLIWARGVRVGGAPVVTRVFPLAAAVRTYTVTSTSTNTCPSQQSVADTITVRPLGLYLPLVLRAESAR